MGEWRRGAQNFGARSTCIVVDHSFPRLSGIGNCPFHSSTSSSSASIILTLPLHLPIAPSRHSLHLLSVAPHRAVPSLCTRAPTRYIRGVTADPKPSSQLTSRASPVDHTFCSPATHRGAARAANYREPPWPVQREVHRPCAFSCCCCCCCCCCYCCYAC